MNNAYEKKRKKQKFILMRTISTKLHWFEDTHAKAVTESASVIIKKFQ